MIWHEVLLIHCRDTTRYQKLRVPQYPNPEQNSLVIMHIYSFVRQRALVRHSTGHPSLGIKVFQPVIKRVKRNYLKTAVFVYLQCLLYFK